MTKERLHEIIFEADTKEGKLFDVALLVLISLSVIIVMLESVRGIGVKYAEEFTFLEWFFTALFSIEYVLRIISLKNPWKYVTSFFGLVDLLSILPSFLGVFFVGSHSLMVIRTFRLLRVFRVFKLAQFLGEANYLTAALRASKAKITVFLGFILMLVVFLGTIMYLIESPESGFTSIPKSIYWAIVTLTTVGYGDIAPETVLGQSIASIIMILGYGIIAVPTGIVTKEMMNESAKVSTQACPACSQEGHDTDAVHCKYCGEFL